MRTDWGYFWRLLSRSFWMALTGLALNIFGVIGFFLPDFGLTEALPWYWWSILGLVVWLITIALIAARERRANSNADDRRPDSPSPIGNHALNDSVLGTRRNKSLYPKVQLVSPGTSAPWSSITFLRERTQPNQYGHENEFRFIVSNNTSTALRTAFVYLEQIAEKRKDRISRSTWRIRDSLPSAKPLKWNEEILGELACITGIDIKPGGKASFCLLDQWPEERYPAPPKKRYHIYDPKFVFCDDRLPGLESGFNYRLRLKFIAEGISSVHYYIFLRYRKGINCWEFNRIELIA